MSFISQTASRFAILPKQLTKSVGSVGIFAKSQCSVQSLTRSLVMLSTPSRMSSNKQIKPTNLCSCGCGIHGMHTKGDKELSDFLQEEIATEKKSQAKEIPMRLDEFTIKKDKSDLELTKNFNDEIITVSVNVNHTVEEDNAVASREEHNEAAQLSSKPDFEVDVKIGSKILSFTCQFTSSELLGEGDHLEDSFGISELTIYEGEWSEKIYCISGDILDGMMYDLMMNYLEERGITNEFSEKLSQLCTDYEHSLYVNLLETLQNFIRRK